MYCFKSKPIYSNCCRFRNIISFVVQNARAVSIAANASETISFVPKYEDPLWARQKDVDVEKEFTIQLRTSSTDYDLVDQFNDDVVIWTASLYVEEPTADGEERVLLTPLFMVELVLLLSY